jgi:hypothetical protein
MPEFDFALWVKGEMLDAGRWLLEIPTSNSPAHSISGSNIQHLPIIKKNK